MVLQYLFRTCITLSISFWLFPIAASIPPKCKETDFVYMYTQCTNQTRWRVAVPGNDCRGGTVEAPSQRYDCDTYCESGKYMSLKSHNEKCEDCPAGTYSIRGGIRFDDWKELPAGFSSTGERGDDSENGQNCTSYQWRAMGPYLAAPSGIPCSAILTYTVTMAKKGKIVIFYKFPASEDNYFTIEVENDQCQMNNNDESFVPPTKADKWGIFTVSLSKGRNRVFFTLIDSGMSNNKKTVSSPYAAPSVFIRAIEVTGVAFTQSCSKCRAGTFSIRGATKCTSCDPNTYSKRSGSAKCKDCPPKFYSIRGSSNCLRQPNCTKQDYYSYWSACDPKTKKISLQYSWIEPKVCSGGVSLPKTSGEYRLCDQNFCDDGMFRATPAICRLCPSGQQPINNRSLSTLSGSATTNASLACKKCPPDHEPVIGLTFSKWWTLPESFTTACLSWRDEDGKCPPSSLWLPKGSYVRSGYSAHAFFSILELAVPGFHNESVENDYVGHIEFEYELVCERKCKLFFMLETNKKMETPLITTGGTDDDTTAKRKQFRYNIVLTTKTKFAWLFQRSTRNVSLDDHVKIFNVNVTNVLNSPALRCEACHMGANNKCVPCAKGKYYSADSKKCVSCPTGQVVWRTPARSIKDCRPCGAGMVSRGGQECVIDFSFSNLVDGKWKKHDFSALKGNQSAKGVHLFTTRSTEYHHIFVLTIDNEQSKDHYPYCRSNVSSLDVYNDGNGSSYVVVSQRINVDEDTQIRSQPGIRALVCQYTLIPPRKKGGKALTAQPLSLGDKLVNVTGTHISAEHAVEMNKRLKKAGWTTDDRNLDIHLTYVTNAKSRNCPSGRSTLLTLRCDPKSETDRGRLLLPPKCPEGTCDGCNYHFMWTTRHACPICNRSDYEVVKGECRAGQQVIYYYPPHFCYFDVGKAHSKITETKRCPLVSSEAEIAIIIVVILGITLLTLLGYFWKRNKRLEYKYMKLVEGAGGRAGELPQAESCAVHEDEDDDDDVHIKSGRGGGGGSSAFFTRFKNFHKNMLIAHSSNQFRLADIIQNNTHGDDNMETVNLTDRDEFGL